MRIKAQPDGVVVVMGASLHADEVADLERLVEPLAPISTLVVDMGNTRMASDSALAQLVLALRRHAISLSVRGLTRHQQRMLRYLGDAHDREDCASGPPQNLATAH